ncbi:MAG TPA: DnaJ domain-containing protein [Thermomicrobiales bacterium]|jgi:hypothetical protein|nr:DnaJ domain-containing protein [Thermomicrobiales bacterium]
MVLPGYADSVDVLGYLIERCNDCEQRSVFTVLEARRRLTLAMIPTPVNINQQRVMECRTCGARFGIPRSWGTDLSDRLMTQGQLAARIRELNAQTTAGMAAQFQQQMGAQQGGGNGRRTAYQVLQVDPSADQDVIEAAFKRLALKAHPDRNEGPEAQHRMRELTAARDLLGNPVRRQQYDRSIGIVRPASAYQPDDVPKSRPSPGQDQARRDPAPQRPAARQPAHPDRDQPKTRADSRPVALPPPGPRPKGIRADEV